METEQIETQRQTQRQSRDRETETETEQRQRETQTKRYRLREFFLGGSCPWEPQAWLRGPHRSPRASLPRDPVCWSF